MRNIYYLLSPGQRRLVRKIWYWPSDLFSKRMKLVPPKGLIFTGAGDFVQIGDKMVGKFIEECNIHRDDVLLDIGSGIGRMARPLTNYLSSDGKYYGFDVVKEGVEWCLKHYKAYPNFEFLYVPLQNDLYNTDVDTVASQFKFPYGDESVDGVICISVFTHMQPEVVANYLSEISRVLKPGKCCFCTLFVMTNKHQRLFKYTRDRYHLHDEKVKDANVAYDFDYIEEMSASAGLRVSKYIVGWWDAGDDNGQFDFQDVIILQKA